MLLMTRRMMTETVIRAEGKSVMEEVIEKRKERESKQAEEFVLAAIQPLLLSPTNSK